jgi:hypothetical protein
MTYRARMPKSSEERQIKLVGGIMDEDREILRALAGRAGDAPANSVEKTDLSAVPRSGQNDDTWERD